jgi:tRNA threonylcarbamoyladenosine biosynthesis protein TsaB
LWQVISLETIILKPAESTRHETLKILAIETSQRHGSVAACQGDILLEEHWLDTRLRTSRSLAPAIAQLLVDVGWRAVDVDLVAVTQGPGSFTGLRIGVTTAKTFGYASGAAVVGLNTLEILAVQLLMDPATTDSTGPTDVVLDAQRNQFFTARYRRQGNQLVRELPTRIVDREEWLAVRKEKDDSLVDGITAGLLPGRQAGQLERSIAAATLGRLAAWRQADPDGWPRDDATWAKAGVLTEVMALVPRYYRQSAAEEKADELQGN